MDRILVTGGAGFIGSNFVRYLLSNTDSTVFNLDKLTYAGNLNNIKDLRANERHEFVRGDIRNNKLVTRLIKRVDAVVNFAAESHVDRSIRTPGVFVQANIVGVHTLLEACRKFEVKFEQISTDEVYGSRMAGSFVETDRLNPSSPYSASKAAADLLTLAYNFTYALDVVITRSTNNYGPHQHPEKLIPKLITNALRRKRFPIYGTGENVRDWIFVEDHCQAIYTVLTKGEKGQSYNIAAGIEKTNIEIAKDVLRRLSLPDTMLDFVGERPGHDFRYSLNCDKIHALGWTPKVAFPDGLQKTVEWYKANKSWWRPLVK
ncbi:MAG TPA: dTDP-glucose 4,6-dehydratase [Candidatus Bathyarchaeia archaeon]|nr:dTDP-glucose 4,6-dehydratase [Candidatus Bathyarchaeia archaeon]